MKRSDRNSITDEHSYPSPHAYEPEAFRVFTAQGTNREEDFSRRKPLFIDTWDINAIGSKVYFQINETNFCWGATSVHVTSFYAPSLAHYAELSGLALLFKIFEQKSGSKILWLRFRYANSLTQLVILRTRIWNIKRSVTRTSLSP